MHIYNLRFYTTLIVRKNAASMYRMYRCFVGQRIYTFGCLYSHFTRLIKTGIEELPTTLIFLCINIPYRYNRYILIRL